MTKLQVINATKVSMKKCLLISLILCSFFMEAQVMVEKNFVLSDTLAESSGLLHYNNQLISFNDSGNKASLYVMNLSSNNIIREVKISNAVNNNWHDWEDITQDEHFIYIGDIGNYYGWRDSLQIYRIAKKDFNHKNEVVAEIISFNYADKTEKTYDEAGSNWDAEALFYYNNQLVLLSKEWKSQQVTAYVIPKTPRKEPYLLKKISPSYNVEGMITGAEFVKETNTLYLVGYSRALQPFLVSCSDFTGNNFFGSAVLKKTISGMGFIAQVEGITAVNSKTLFFTTESLKKKIKGFTLTVDGSLYGLLLP